MVTKRPSNWSPGLILGAFCTIYRARPVGRGLGAEFGRKPAKNKNPNTNHTCIHTSLLCQFLLLDNTSSSSLHSQAVLTPRTILCKCERTKF